MKIEKVTPYIGAEVTDIDSSRPLSDRAREELRAAFLENLVLFFRDQELTLPEHIAFGRNFGQMYIHPAAKKAAEAASAVGNSAAMSLASSLPEHPEIMRIYADENSKRVAGETWHSDVSSELEPPLGSILRLVEIPPCGGDTLFASMYAAYDGLSESMKSFLAPLTAIHDGAVYERSGAFEIKQYPRSEHPVIRTHPETGRQALFVSETFTTRIVQLSESESKAVLQHLFSHLSQPKFQCRFRWRKHSMAFWDNRCAQHQAQWDYFPHRRVGYRVQLVGDRPYFHAAIAAK